MRAGASFCVAVLALLVSGCASKPPLVTTPYVTVLPDAALPPPPGIDMASKERPYFIGPFDQLRIDVFGIPEMSDRRVQVDASGRASFPLVGSFEAAGRTPLQLSEDLQRRLAERYLRNPQVTVNVEETVSQVITVDGQVARPGLYPVLGQMTLTKAVATAGGTTEFAKLEDIVVFRTVGDQRYAALYNLELIRRGYYGDPELFANDTIFVGDSPARRVFKDILMAAPLITTPIVALLQNR